MTNKKIFFLGIKGVAMTGLAIIMKKMGNYVTGSDEKNSFITDEVLKKHSIEYKTSFDPKIITKDIDVFIYSAAHNGKNNPQTKKAIELKIKVFNQAEFIASLLPKFENTVAVAGSHGKTTTSSLLSYLLIKLGVQPSYLTGSSGFNDYSGGDYFKNEYFIFEADEYAVDPPFNKKIKLSYFCPDNIIITNIDFDHPDVYLDIENSKKVFEDFINKGKKIFYCEDDLLLRDSVKKSKIRNTLSFGYSHKSNLQISSFVMNDKESSFRLTFNGKNLGNFKTKLFGEKNISNIAGCILFLLDQGFDIKKIKNVLISFNGAKRRNEKIFERNDILLFDDYGHHPVEILSVLKTFKKIFKNKRLIVIFHPHTYSRTKMFLLEFSKSLSIADYSIILPIFSSAREKAEDFNISSYDIEKNTPVDRNNLKAVSSKKEALYVLSKILKRGDIILTMGAGDVYLMHNKIINLINNLK